MISANGNDAGSIKALVLYSISIELSLVPTAASIYLCCRGGYHALRIPSDRSRPFS